MKFIRPLQSTQNRHGIFNGGFGNVHRLKSARKSGILLNLTILIERGCTNKLQLSASKAGLEHVRHIHGSLSLSSSNHGMKLINEQDHFAIGRLNVLDDALQPLFELTAEHCAGQELSQIEADYTLILHRFGHLSRHDALGQPLGNGRLAYARFTDKDRIILCSSSQYLQCPADFIVSTDDRVQFSLLGHLGEIDAVLLQILAWNLRIRVDNIQSR
mmetsp:Transcript_27288/g.63858  ORF Transcript_27288/g.63858 Transcript_27288/m.63858 type:complete len:216 (-) Transcript_27288:415-1062(-)